VSSSHALLLSSFCSSVVLEGGLLGESGDFDELGVEGIFFAFLSGNELRTSESGYNLHYLKRRQKCNINHETKQFSEEIFFLG
jgi:hypothetical protein